jgi:hypothetical protein
VFCINRVGRVQCATAVEKTIRRGLVLRAGAFQCVRPNGIVHHSAIAVRGLSNVLWYSFRFRQELRKPWLRLAILEPKDYRVSSVRYWKTRKYMPGTLLREQDGLW